MYLLVRTADLITVLFYHLCWSVCCIASELCTDFREHVWQGSGLVLRRQIPGSWVHVSVHAASVPIIIIIIIIIIDICCFVIIIIIVFY